MNVGHRNTEHLSCNQRKKMEEIFPGIAALIKNVSCIDAMSIVSRTREVNMPDRNAGC